LSFVNFHEAEYRLTLNAVKFRVNDV
jgi:hypothetical protein